MIKLISLDVFRTLLDCREDKDNPDAYDQLARFLGYHGVGITGKNLKEAVETETYIKSVVSQYSFPTWILEKFWTRLLLSLVIKHHLF